MSALVTCTRVTRPRVNAELARLLRAETPLLEDEQFVLTLAEVARTSNSVPIRQRIPLAVKVGAVAASVAVTMFGAAYASDLFTPTPPTNLNPSSPGTEEPTEREREIREPRKSDEPVDVEPSPATVTKSSEPSSAPTGTEEGSTPEHGTSDATAPADTEEGQPPHTSDPGPGDDDSGSDGDEGSGQDDSEGEPDSDDDSGPDDDSEDDDEDMEDESETDQDSEGPAPEDEPDTISDDD